LRRADHIDFPSAEIEYLQLLASNTTIIDEYKLMLYEKGKLKDTFDLPKYSHVVYLSINADYIKHSSLWLWYVDENNKYLSYNIIRRTIYDMECDVIKKDNYLCIGRPPNDMYVVLDDGKVIHLSEKILTYVEVIGNFIFVNKKGEYYNYTGKIIDQTKYIPYIENRRQVKSARKN
jgi:hypothetical protein